jgi:Fe2+ or Zn2+ uptake regulation protein
MEINTDYLSEKLKRNKLKPSHQRLKILQFISTHPCHPTVDQIYNALHSELPTLSKATIYNTLSAFEESGLVQKITIEDNEVRYDFDTLNHGHFKCRVCGKIFDFKVSMDDDVPYHELDDFKVETKNVYFIGVCKDCVKAKNN